MMRKEHGELFDEMETEIERLNTEVTKLQNLRSRYDEALDAACKVLNKLAEGEEVTAEAAEAALLVITAIGKGWVDTEYTGKPKPRPRKKNRDT
jgi:hypothetical protein